MTLTNKLVAKKSEYYPILGEPIDKLSILNMDFTSNNLELNHLDLTDTKAFDEYIVKKLKINQATIGIGGYAENRAIYKRSEHFNGTDEPRTVHLGVDIWTNAGTSIFSPLDGEIHSFKNNKNFGDYGPTIIMKHQIDDSKFYILYGHLSSNSIDNQYIGKKIKKGELLCQIGNFPENGDWPPHLHFQIIENIGDNFGDYPGVCKFSEKDIYLNNCPDANIVLGLI
jgi:peptidoglycan LD-endopeptidase LytH